MIALIKDITLVEMESTLAIRPSPRIEEFLEMMLLPEMLRDLIYNSIARSVTTSIEPDRILFQNANFLNRCRQAAEELLPILLGYHSDILPQIIRMNGSLDSPIDLTPWLGRPNIAPGLLLHHQDPKALSNILRTACYTSQTDIASAVGARMVTLEVDKDAYKDGLCHTIRHGDREVAEAILEAGPELDKEVVYEGEGNPIQTACRFGRYEIVRLLLDKGADIHAPKEHMNALSTACYYGRLEIAELLLTRGADVYRISGNRNRRLSAQGAAATTGQDEIFKMLLKQHDRISEVREHILRPGA
jgi:ankyrin repeat protein